MNDLLNSPSFSGETIPWQSDLSLVLILVTAAMLTIGRQLALRKRYDLHGRVQTIAVILNTIVVLVNMIGAFITYILPGIPAKLAEGSYGVTTVHAAVGLVGMLLGVFIVLRAHKLVPKALRFNNYKRFMRTSYLIYMAATLLGVIVYIVVYVYGI